MNKYIHNGSPRSRREKGAETLFEEKMAEKFLNLGEDMELLSKKLNFEHRINIKRNTLRYIL